MNKEVLLQEIYNSAFNDELEKRSSIASSVTSFIKSPKGIASSIVGAGTVGAGFIDTRKLPDREAKTILPYWDEVKKYSQPGDVIIGANRPPAIISYFTDFKDNYSKFRKEKMSHSEAMAQASELVNPATIISKLGDPVYSHAAIIGPNGTSIYGGGGKARDITLRDIPKDAKQLKEFRERGLEPFYALLRPNKPEANKLQVILKAQGPDAALKEVERMAGRTKDYNASRALWEQFKQWTLPKLDKEEFVKSKAVRDLEKEMTGGVCSTTMGLLSDRTISGKEAKALLPVDIIESPDFDIVAYVGKDRNIPLGTQMIFSAPKYGIKAGTGIAAGAATYGIFNGVNAMLKSKTSKNLLSKLVLKK